jgi:hypothetical protein
MYWHQCLRRAFHVLAEHTAVDARRPTMESALIGMFYSATAPFALRQSDESYGVPSNGIVAEASGVPADVR